MLQKDLLLPYRTIVDNVALPLIIRGVNKKEARENPAVVKAVVDYFSKSGIAQVKVQDHSVRIGDTLQIHGNSTGVVELTAGELRRDDEVLEVAEKGNWFTLKTPRCRVGDKVFYIESKI